jgi:hypothetical protein
VADISRAADQSPYVPAQVKASLKECTRRLEAECAKLEHLTQLAHRAAQDASNVIRWRIRFFDALDDRILELSQLRARFVDSRRAFREQPNNLLTGEIRHARGRVDTGMLSGVKPLFDKIDKYYNEVNVSLRVEEECLWKIRSSLRVTPDDKRRWEHIRDACNETFHLLSTGVSATSPLIPSMPTSDNQAPLPPAHMSQPIVSTFVIHLPFSVDLIFLPSQSKNKAARNINALAQTVLDARQSLQQARQDITDLTQHPQIGLLRLQSEYEDSKGMCQQRIGEVLQFSEQFLRSFVEIPPLDDFRDDLLPSAAESSSRILQEVYGQMKSNSESRTRPNAVKSSP